MVGSHLSLRCFFSLFWLAFIFINSLKVMVVVAVEAIAVIVSTYMYLHITI